MVTSLPNSVGFAILPFANRLGVRLEDAEHFVGHVRIAAQEARAAFAQGRARRAAASAASAAARAAGSTAVAPRRGPARAGHAADHRRRVPHHRARRRHQLPIAADQRVACLGDAPGNRSSTRGGPTLRSRSRMRPGRSPSAALARCIVRVSTRTPSCSNVLSVG